MNNPDDFDQVLIESINKTLRYVFGDKATQIIYEHLEKKSCPLFEIPKRPNIFSSELRMILNSEGGQISRSTRASMLTPILEKAILKELSHKLGIFFSDDEPIIFEEHVKRLRGAYERGRRSEPFNVGRAVYERH